jgi:hypothetical protein
LLRLSKSGHSNSTERDSGHHSGKDSELCNSEQLVVLALG